MRRPTPQKELYRYYWDALDDIESVSPHPNDPQAGFYRARLVKDGPWVPVAIWVTQTIDKETGELLEPEALVCVVNGKHADPDEAWNWCCQNPIKEPAYRYYEANRKWEEEFLPSGPAANPKQAVNLLTNKPAF